MYSILMATYCNPEYLKLCVDSIIENSHYNTHQLCVHVNGYDKDTLDYLGSKDIKYTITEENIGCTAINYCIDQAIYDNVLLTNDDCYFTKDWDLNLHRWEEELNIKFLDYKKIIGYRWCEPIRGSFQPICNAGRTINEFNIDKLNEYIIKNSRHEVTDRWLFNSLYPRDLFSLCRISPEFFIAAADIDFMMKVLKYLKNNNIKFLIFGIDDCCIYHFQGRASAKNKLKLVNKDDVEVELYKQKWGMGIGDSYKLIRNETKRSVSLIKEKS